ncbi:MAG: hypothetical protein JNN07_02850, partial [Verrucomicrobiales bacterium]|nr:hypothetical protein [Verrucomicrobiales bacterium]
MKTTLSIALVMALGLQCSLGQAVVHDPLLEFVTITNHLAQLARMAQTIQELQQTKDRLGDAASILSISGVGETLLQIAQTGIGQSRTAIASIANSALAFAYQ